MLMRHSLNTLYLRLGSGVHIVAIEATGATVSNIRTSSPGLEDVFLALTGRDMRQEA